MSQDANDLAVTDIIRDPIFGYIEITLDERKIIDHPLFQRLRRLHQLHIAHYTYPSATHTRFAHSLGVMHVASLFAEQLLRSKCINIENFFPCPFYDRLKIEKTEDKRGEFKKILINAVRIAALLHDIGHGPFSHAFDSVFSKIIIGDDTVAKEAKIKLDHEKFGFLIVFSSDILDVIDDKSNLCKWLILSLLMPLFDRNKERDIFYTLLENHANEAWKKNWLDTMKDCFIYNNFKIAWPLGVLLRFTFREFPWCADIIDFVLRDSYFSGTIEYGWVDWQRLIKYSSIIRIQNDDKLSFAIAISNRALDALKNFLLARYFMYSTVYYHRTTRRHDLDLSLIINLAIESLGLIDYLSEVIKNSETLNSFLLGDWIRNFTDESFLSYIEDITITNLLNKLRCEEKGKEDISVYTFLLWLIFRLRNRSRIYNFIAEIPFEFSGTTHVPEILELELVPHETFLSCLRDENICGIIPIPYDEKRKKDIEEKIKKVIGETVVKVLRREAEYIFEEVNSQTLIDLRNHFIKYINSLIRQKLQCEENVKRNLGESAIIEKLISSIREAWKSVAHQLSLVDIILIDIIPHGLSDIARKIYVIDQTGYNERDISEYPLPSRMFKKVYVRLYALSDYWQLISEDEKGKLIEEIIKEIHERLKPREMRGLKGPTY